MTKIKPISDEKFEELWIKMKGKDLAVLLGVSGQCISAKALKMGLRKLPSHIECADNVIPGGLPEKE